MKVSDIDIANRPDTADKPPSSKLAADSNTLAPVDRTKMLTPSLAVSADCYIAADRRKAAENYIANYIVAPLDTMALDNKNQPPLAAVADTSDTLHNSLAVAVPVAERNTPERRWAGQPWALQPVRCQPLMCKIGPHLAVAHLVSPANRTIRIEPMPPRGCMPSTKPPWPYGLHSLRNSFSRNPKVLVTYPL
jgi:hypothetical protein